MIRARAVRIAVISDIHGNLAALEAVLAAVAGRCDQVWCLGDVVGYGARPNECVDVVRDRCRVVLAGNHDLAAVGVVDASRFSHDAGRAIRWTREVLRNDCERWLRELSPALEREHVGLFHGSPRDPVWEYVLDATTAEAAIRATDVDVVLCGHTHGAIAALLDGPRLSGGRATHGREVTLSPARRALLNPGSVGQPRDGDPRASYLLLEFGDDGRPRRGRFLREPYDIARTQREIALAGLPQHLADRLSFGM
jgi:diadenosine tetraphosphatase ApaH/serine/threonine PP2A family protein phosphatase